MAITGFTTDYSNRTKDINVLKVASYTNNQTQTDTVAFGNPSQYITGIEKLVQKYAILFLTKIGSQINNPTFGTNFLTTLNTSSALLSRLDVLHLFNFANLDVLDVLKPFQANNPSIPADEQLLSANLVSFATSPGTLSISIAITSFAGNNITFVLPIPLT